MFSLDELCNLDYVEGNKPEDKGGLSHLRLISWF